MTALILHGGAGAKRGTDYSREAAHMREVVEAMKARLDAGASALDVVVALTPSPPLELTAGRQIVRQIPSTQT